VLYLRKKYLQESGITLLELLVTIVISTLVMGLAFSVLTSSIKYNEKTQASINLKKESNYVLSQLRQLHNGPEHEFCYEDSLSDKSVSFKNIELGNNNPNSKKCIVVNTSKELKVNFTLTDNQNNQFEIQTTIETNRPSQSAVAIEIERPEKGQDLYDFLKDNYIFTYSQNLLISGSASMYGNGTIIITNGDSSDLKFTGGGSKLLSKEIYLDRKGKNVILDDSAQLGSLENTDIVSIKGNVKLNHGTSQIAGKNIFIDGNVEFNNEAFIKAKRLFISGDVNFNYETAKITAEEIYINGAVKKFKPNLNHLSRIEKKFDIAIMPMHKTLNPMKSRNRDWYTKNNYVSGGKLLNGMKVYTTDYNYGSWMGDTKNVVIVSEKDIVISNMGGSSLSGVLIAPNGKVVFNGEKFEGIIITKNGITMGQGNTPVTFKNIEEYIPNKNEFPLQ